MSSESAPSSPSSINLVSETTHDQYHSPPGSPSFTLRNPTLLEGEGMSESGTWSYQINITLFKLYN